MESGAEPSPVSVLDREQPISQEELDEIETALESVSSLLKRRRHCTDDNEVRSNVRRLPNWGTQQSSTVNPDCQYEISNLEDEKSSPIESPNTLAGSSYPRNRHSNILRSSRQVHPKVRYTTMNFGGRIVYSRTGPEVEKATMELLESIDAKKKNMDQVILGLDIEWRPTFRRGDAPRKAAVMQICGDTGHCYVMHIIHSGIPPILQSLLEDSTSTKVGVCIANDAVKVLKDYNVRIKSLEDLSCLANLKLGGTPRKWSLASLTEMLTCKQLEKPNKIRLGNWEADVLSREKLQYAATDAFVSWHLYQILRSFPDAADNQKVEEVNGLQS